MRSYKNDDFNNISLSKTTHKILNSELTDDNHITSKSYIHSLSEKDRNRRDLSLVFNDQVNKFDNNKLTSLVRNYNEKKSNCRQGTLQSKKCR